MVFLPLNPAGILYGTMTLELGGQITIACEKTGYSAQLEFKLKVRLKVADDVTDSRGKFVCLLCTQTETRTLKHTHTHPDKQEEGMFATVCF